jgi:hypothetical protein
LQNFPAPTLRQGGREMAKALPLRGRERLQNGVSP